MARAFAKIAFTPNVQAAQARMGSLDAYRHATSGEPDPVELGPHEIDFIAARDSFYQATVGETGWPYIQHRGGPAGFLKVLGPRTLGYADFSGNRQYISVGNLDGDARISLFLMDYPGQRRLKILGRARWVDDAQDPALVAQVETPHYRARVERAVIITVEAFDWNCPKHITPRFTEQEVRDLLDSNQDDAPASGPLEYDASAPRTALGRGPLPLVITGVRQLTPRVRAYELSAADGRALPSATAGAHLALPVQLADGSVVTRQYSLAENPEGRDRYEIAVLREADGRGGSAAIHAGWQLGTGFAVDPPVNHFPLHEDDRHAVLIAGGIGITPIKAMAEALSAHGGSFELHYSGRTGTDMAYRDRLNIEMQDNLRLYFTRAPDATRMDVRALMAAAPPDAVFYVCGPEALIAAVLAAADTLAIPSARVQYERFD